MRASSSSIASFFAQNACEVAQHVRINDETGTAEGRALFNQENVPTETLFYSVVHAFRERTPKGQNRTAEMAYFVGCVSSMFPMTYPIPQAFTNVLGRAGVRFTVLGPEEWCCGFPQMMGGQLEQAKPLIQHNVERMRALGIPRVVATCPSCYHMWKHVYPEMVEGALGFEVVHAVEVLNDLVASGRLQLASPQPGSIVTYHDPCDLGRKGDIYEAPRRVLEAIPDCEFIEMVQNREHALCCGGGGDMETFDPNILAEVSARRIAQAAEIGANYLISACPQCVRTLQKAAKTGRLRIKVMDITQFVEMATQ